MKLKTRYEPVKMISHKPLEIIVKKGYDTKGRSEEGNAKLDLLAITLSLGLKYSITSSLLPAAFVCLVVLPRKSSLAILHKYGGVCQQNKENKVFKFLYIMHHSHQLHFHQILQETLLEDILQAVILDTVN